MPCNMQQQYHKFNIHTRNTNASLPISYRQISSDCAQIHRTFGHHNQTNENFIPCPNTLVLPSVVHSDVRRHTTSPRIYALQPQPQESQVKRSSREIKNASNFERSESFIT